jgi:signal transduction histidine kinase
MSDPGPDARLERILEVLCAYVRMDFSARVPIFGNETLDGIATGLNILGEELEHTAASRSDLEAAYDDLRRAEAKLVQAGKMAAVGLLAAGVAHEVNNPAAWVSLSLGMMRRSLARIHKLAEQGDDPKALADEFVVIEGMLADCMEGMKRVNSVVGDLLVFSRANDASFEPIAFEEVVASSWRLARGALHDLSLVLELGDTPTLIANRGRVAQVVMNLLLNAAHAMTNCAPEVKKRIIVSTHTHDGGVLLAVEDSGAGIPEEIRSRVFDPFFTTKPAREGTGLGLTIVGQIADSYGGWARVGTPVGTGARLEVWFPCEPRQQPASSDAARP